MRLDELPERLVILGGGYIAAEFAHVFSALGDRGDGGGPRRAGCCAAGPGDLRRGSPSWPATGGTSRSVSDTDRRQRRQAAASGSISPTARRRRGRHAAGGHRPGAQHRPARTWPRPASTLDDGRVVGRRLPAHERRGDVGARRHQLAHQLKHVANHEARVVAAQPDAPGRSAASDHRFVPRAVFTYPQIASVGLTEDAGRASRGAYVTASPGLRRHRLRLGDGGHRPASASCSPTRAPGCCSARTSSARRRPT